MRHATIGPAKAPPDPYWRKSVARTLYLKPDVRTSRSHTVCWEGVISPAVCTSGAQLCTGVPRPTMKPKNERAAKSDDGPAMGASTAGVTNN